MDKQGPRSSDKDKAEIDTFQNMKTEATKAATRTGLLRTKPEKSLHEDDRIVSGMNIMKLIIRGILCLYYQSNSIQQNR